MPVKGLKVCTPTSIAYSGTSASINADGSVSFTACTSLSLNGVFTSDYDNYMVTIRGSQASDTDLNGRLRSSGTDSSASYTNQYIQARSTTVSSNRNASAHISIGSWGSTQRAGTTLYLFGPYLAQPTATRTVGLQDTGSASIYDIAATHSVSSSYDGLTLFSNGSNMTGLLTVAGWVQ